MSSLTPSLRNPASLTYMWKDSITGAVETEAHPVEFFRTLTDDLAQRLTTGLREKTFFTASLNPGTLDIRIINAKDIICVVANTLQPPSYQVPYLSNVFVHLNGKQAAVGISLQDEPERVKRTVQKELERKNPFTLLTDQLTRSILFNMEDVREIQIKLFDHATAPWIKDTVS